MWRLKSREAKLLAQDHTASVAEVEFEPRAPTFKYCTTLPPDLVRNLSSAAASLCDPWQEAELLSLSSYERGENHAPALAATGRPNTRPRQCCEQSRRHTGPYRPRPSPKLAPTPRSACLPKHVFWERVETLDLLQATPLFNRWRAQGPGQPDSSKVTLSLQENSPPEALPPLWKVGIVVLRPRCPHPFIQELTSS